MPGPVCDNWLDEACQLNKVCNKISNFKELETKRQNYIYDFTGGKATFIKGIFLVLVSKMYRLCTNSVI